MQRTLSKDDKERLEVHLCEARSPNTGRQDVHGLEVGVNMKNWEDVDSGLKAMVIDSFSSIVLESAILEVGDRYSRTQVPRSSGSNLFDLYLHVRILCAPG